MSEQHKVFVKVAQLRDRAKAALPVAVPTAALALLALATSPVTMGFTASFSFDVSSLMTTAEDWFNGLFPVMVPILGIMLGIALLSFVAGMIRKALAGAAK